MDSNCTAAFILAFILIVIPCFATSASASRSQTGIASYYADFFHGRTTASGVSYDKNSLTAAHRFLKFGTTVRVTHLKNGKSVIVKINDRGPFVEPRIIDLSRAAAKKLGMISQGIADVKVEILKSR